VYRLYSRYLHDAEYDDIDRLLTHLSSKSKLTQKEAEKIEDKCKEVWKRFILQFLARFENEAKRYEDIIGKEKSDLRKIKTQVELNDLPLGEYDNIWDKIEDIYLQAMYKIKTDKRNLKRDLVFFILGILSGILISLLGRWL